MTDVGRRVQRAPRRAIVVASACLAVVALNGCASSGTGGRAIAANDPPATRPASSAPASPSTTTTPPQQLTRPIDPPADERGPEDNPPIGRIAIPAIGLDDVLEEGIRLTTLDRGPGHWPGSAMPGEIGNVVVAGHRSSQGAEFRELDALEPGHEVIFTTGAGTFTYAVTGTEIVTPDALWITDPTDTPTATLFACHPLRSTAQRIVVHLALVA